jgi:hypothetical protein
VSHWLAMANCTINPFIYGYSNKKFRVNIKFKFKLKFYCIKVENFIKSRMLTGY